MQRFPAEFSDVLTDDGRRWLYQGHQDDLSHNPNRSFMCMAGVIQPRFCQEAYYLLNARLYKYLSDLEQKIPLFSTWHMVQNYRERLPKVVRMKTIDMTSYNRAYQMVKEIGLLQMLDSESFYQFVSKLSGYRLRKKMGKQVLCYERGDYIGPHNDHHPEDPEASSGYIDCHISFAGPGVQHQYLIYEQNRHLTEMQAMHHAGVITIYRLPFWHYTTPLAVDEGSLVLDQRRWVVLGTFLFDKRDKNVQKWQQEVSRRLTFSESK